jgi:hypothetical protein
MSEAEAALEHFQLYSYTMQEVQVIKSAQYSTCMIFDDLDSISGDDGFCTRSNKH